jgi:hypothetical protein
MNRSTPRSTPTLSYASLVSGTDSSLSSYKEQEEYDVGTYTLSLEAIYHDIEVMSLNVDAGNEPTSENYDIATVPEKPREGKTISFDSSADKSASEKEESVPKKQNRKKHAKSKRLKRGVEEWRNVVSKEHRWDRRHGDKKEDR